MGYVAARGGFGAIRAAEELIARRRRRARSPWLEVDQITDRLGYAVDRVMGEGGLWAPELAARAIRQAEGDIVEASHLIRAHRATLPRLAYGEPVAADEIDVVRRIVPAFREPPGPQLLGHTPDYTGRLLDLTPEDEARADAARAASAAAFDGHEDGSPRGERPVPPDGGVGGPVARMRRADRGPAPSEAGAVPPEPVPRVPGRLLDLLRAMDLAVDRRRDDDPEPVDITREPVRPGAPRSARLSAMARAESGALVQLWYRNILGPDDHLHEITLGEVRHGRLAVRVRHPLTGGRVQIGAVRVTEVEAIEDLDAVDEDRTKFDVGYGLCLGHNEKKAIAMANLDIALHRESGSPELEQSVLMTTDGLDASGFLEHLKLPHYVTFRSMIERKMRRREAAPVATASPVAPVAATSELTPVATTSPVAPVAATSEPTPDRDVSVPARGARGDAGERP